jgi:phosphoribosyl-AMP cyclohydrolase
VPRLERGIEGLDGALVERVVGQLYALEPEATAVLLTGSYVTGTAVVASDLDLVAITPSPRVAYRTWFEEQVGVPPLHISASATTADAWLAKATSPARWSFGFPAIAAAAYLCTDDQTRTKLGNHPSLRHPPAGPELEDFLDFVLKAKRAARTGDELGLRWFAHCAAALAPTLLLPSNQERIVRDRRDALDAALTLPVAPATYAADLPVCLGLTLASGGEMSAAVARLGSELLAFLRERTPNVDAQPELTRYLADGTLERHLGLIE